MIAFYPNRKTCLNVLIVQANQPLVGTGGAQELSEQYYQAARQCEPVLAFYDFLLCGGEPYAVWV